MLEGFRGILYYGSSRFAAPPFPPEARLAQVTDFGQLNVRSEIRHFLVETLRPAQALPCSSAHCSPRQNCSFAVAPSGSLGP